jgi:hypothetical protein
VANRKWSELSAGQQRAICVGGAAEAVLTLAALRDLHRRPADEVRGPKAAWRLGVFVQPVGPIVYFLVGRSPRPATASP